MKKIVAFILSTTLLFMLAACNQPAKQTEKSNLTKTPKTNELTLKEVMEKALEVNNKLKSFHVNMDMTQKMSTSSQPEPMNMSSNINMDVQINPLAFYQKMEMSMEGQPQTFQTQSYFSEDGFFLFDQNANKWMKFPKEMSDQILQMSTQQTDPAKELEKLQQFIEDFTFEQKEQHYILHLKASGEKFNAYLKETVKETLPQELALDDQVFNDMKFNQVEYTLYIDKETFYINSMDMMMDIEMKVDQENISMYQEVTGNYSMYNGIDAITVPQNVLDTAEEMQ